MSSNSNGNTATTVTIADLLSRMREDCEYMSLSATRTAFGPARTALNMRRGRMGTTLASIARFITQQSDSIITMSAERARLTQEVDSAIMGLRDFIAMLILLPMAEETRAQVQMQLDAINAAIEARQMIATPVAVEPATDSRIITS